MSQSPPAISVLMPVYNCEKYLSAAVGSVLAQTRGDFELVAVNDGSTDGSLEILRKFEREDSRVRVISRPNTGIVGALNDGFALCRGAYVARMDGDDISEPERLALQIQAMAENPSWVIVGSWAHFIDVDGDLIAVSQPPLEHGAILSMLRQGRGDALIHPTALIRRSAVSAIGGYRQEYQYVEDMDLYFRLSKIGRLANIPRHLLRYRQHAMSTNATRFGQQMALIKKLVDPLRAEAGMEEIWKQGLPRQDTRASYHLTMARVANNSGYFRAARKNAWRALGQRPFEPGRWKTLARSLLGRLYGKAALQKNAAEDSNARPTL